MINNLRKHYLLCIALAFALVSFGLMFVPYAVFSGSVVSEAEHNTMTVAGNVNGISMAFGVNYWLIFRVTDLVSHEANVSHQYQELPFSAGMFIALIALIIGFLLSLSVALKDKHPRLVLGSGALFLLDSILTLCSVQVGHVPERTMSILGQSIVIHSHLGIGAILSAVILLAAAALVIADFFYRPSNFPTGVKFKQSLFDDDILVSVRHLKMFFPMGKNKLKAVHDVSFDIKKGECFGVVGESGCGKTTTGRTLIRLYDATSGSIYFKGYRINAGSRWNEKEIKWTKIRARNAIKALKAKEKAEIDEMDSATEQGRAAIEEVKARYEKEIRSHQEHVREVVKTQNKKIAQIHYDNTHVDPRLISKMQMIFQDPIDSLDPRMTVEEIISEGLRIQGFHNKAENHKKVCEVLEEVGLIPDYCSRYPNEFSGGQRQRIGIARAIVMNPEFMICDEPISALDVSIRAQIINLLNDLKENHGLTLMFIAHDLSVVKYFCDRIAVMYFGEIVEMAPSDELFTHPLHPYTRALLSAIPKPDPLSERKRQRIVYTPSKEHDYSVEKPRLQEILPGHFVLANKPEMEKYHKLIEEDDAKAEEVKKTSKAK